MIKKDIPTNADTSLLVRLVVAFTNSNMLALENEKGWPFASSAFWARIRPDTFIKLRTDLQFWNESHYSITSASLTKLKLILS